MNSKTERLINEICEKRSWAPKVDHTPRDLDSLTSDSKNSSKSKHNTFQEHEIRIDEHLLSSLTNKILENLRNGEDNINFKIQVNKDKDNLTEMKKITESHCSSRKKLRKYSNQNTKKSLKKRLTSSRIRSKL